MNTIKVLLTTAMLLLSGLSFADEAAKAEAEKLLNSMGMEKAFEQTIVQMLNAQIQQNPTIAPFKSTMQKFFEKHMSFESLKPQMVTLYADVFTAEELAQINAFYKTPVGQKTLQKMPELMSKAAQIGAQKVQNNMPELQNMMKEEAQRIKQK